MSFPSLMYSACMAQRHDRKLFSSTCVGSDLELNDGVQREMFSQEVLDVPACNAGNVPLVTHTDHTRYLLEQNGRWREESQSSAEWLQVHSLQNSGLTLTDLLSHATTKLVAAETNSASSPLEINAGAVGDFESRLHRAIQLYHSRIGWLTKGSREVFGLVKGSRVGVIVDTSQANCESGRLQELKKRFLCLLDEQLSSKKQLYLLSFGTADQPLWDGLRDVNQRRLQEALQWVQQLGASRSGSLLQAIKRALTCPGLDSLLIILGSCPDQNTDVFFDYVEQCTVGRGLLVHIVAYDTTSHITVASVRRLAEVTRGRFHLFLYEPGMRVNSSDLELLWRELEGARELLSQIQQMWRGLIGEMEVSVVQEISGELDDVRPSCLVPKPPNHNTLLHIHRPRVPPTSSADWLKTYGLKAKRLGLYQVLGPNAYSQLEEFVPILGKTVCSQVHEKAMVQFEWHDGTVKNVHVDLPLLYSYQKQLLRAVRGLERRAAWLRDGSRQIWGALCEQSVMILVDASLMNSLYLLHIQQSLKLLLEEQLASQQWFNIIAFGSDVKKWNDKMFPATEENLQDAWQWVQGLQCDGSRNTLEALRWAFERDLQRLPIQSLGLYLFTSGVPNQDLDAVTGYVSECCGGCDLRLHVCFFSGDDGLALSQSPPRFATRTDTGLALKSLAHSGRGRFHWVDKIGIVESDDIKALTREMETAANYLQKTSLLVDVLTQRAGGRSSGESSVLEGSPSRDARRRKEKLPAPRPTALTLARLQAKENQLDDHVALKALAWRPTSFRAEIPPAQHMNGLGWSGVKVRQREPRVCQSVFYTEEGNRLGVIFKKYPKAKTLRKCIPSVILPTEEEICSSEQWLAKYGTRKLKLDLHRLVSGPGCAHQKEAGPAVQTNVSAKHCAVLPSVLFNGSVKHLQLTPRELDQYLRQTGRLLSRYERRVQWLLSGSRRMFGTVLEKEVCLLLDTSGSMALWLPHVKRELKSLVWEQLHQNSVRFTLLAFSAEVRAWRTSLVQASEEACHDAVLWTSQLSAYGGTCTLEALQAACGLGDTLGCYLLTDGKPDSSCSLVLKETEKLTKGRQITIHTISLNCKDSIANDFLKKLAAQTGGRFHRYHSDEAPTAASEMLMDGPTDQNDPVLPALGGDDLRKLSQEIDKLRRFREQAGSFRTIILEKQNPC